MSFFRHLPGLLETLGGFGRSAISRAIETGRTIGEFLGIIKPLVPEVSLPEAVHEWGQVRISGERKKQVAGLAPEAYVPRDWFIESDIPWKTPIAYTVAIYGRDMATGRIISQEYNVTVSRPLTTGEVLDETRARFSEIPDKKYLEIWSAKVVGAFTRAGEEWRW